mgnify:CR=1 FL=1
MAKRIEVDGFPARRIGESIIERECREEGVDVYQPSYWTVQRHHRNKRILEKRYPLFIGYAFVLISSDDFERVRFKVPSVTSFLRLARYGAPAQFSESIISRLMLDEFESRQTFLLDKAQQDLENAVEEKEKLRRERRAVSHRISSATRRRKANLDELARMQMAGMQAEDRARLQAIERELKALENFDGASMKIAS